jgi:predicted nucleotidyltransferase
MAIRKDKEMIYEDIRKYLSLLRKQNIPVLEAYLFGSIAKGIGDEWSDIDIAIVTDSFIGDSFDFRYLLTKLARNIDPDIEPHPYLASDFNAENPIAAEIMKHGEKLIEQ